MLPRLYCVKYSQTGGAEFNFMPESCFSRSLHRLHQALQRHLTMENPKVN